MLNFLIITLVAYIASEEVHLYLIIFFFYLACRLVWAVMWTYTKCFSYCLAFVLFMACIPYGIPFSFHLSYITCAVFLVSCV